MYTISVFLGHPRHRSRNAVIRQLQKSNTSDDYKLTAGTRNAEITDGTTEPNMPSKCSAVCAWARAKRAWIIKRKEKAAQGGREGRARGEEDHGCGRGGRDVSEHVERQQQRRLDDAAANAKHARDQARAAAHGRVEQSGARRPLDVACLWHEAQLHIDHTVFALTAAVATCSTCSQPTGAARQASLSMSRPFASALARIVPPTAERTSRLRLPLRSSHARTIVMSTATMGTTDSTSIQ